MTDTTPGADREQRERVARDDDGRHAAAQAWCQDDTTMAEVNAFGAGWDAALAAARPDDDTAARALAAAELRAAADGLTDRVRTWVLNYLRDRADALAPEAIRGLVQLEAQERDRAAGMAAKAVAAGLATRQVELAERQGALVADLIRRMFADPELGLTAEQAGRAPVVAARYLRALAGGETA